MKNFLIVLLVVLLLGAVGASAYFYGKTQTGSSQNQTTSYIYTPKPSPTATPVPSQTFAAGGLFSFSAYSITVPDDWETSVKQDTQTSTVLISKGEYQIKIYQAATGGARCLYPGDPSVQEPSSVFTKFIDLTTDEGKALRRGTTDGKGFSFCIKQTDGNYFQPTTYGHISYKTPPDPDPKILEIMDNIIKTIKKK